MHYSNTPAIGITSELDLIALASSMTPYNCAGTVPPHRSHSTSHSKGGATTKPCSRAGGA